MADTVVQAEGATESATQATEAEAKPVETAEGEGLDKKIATTVKGWIETSKKDRRQLFPDWKRNVELRMGKLSTTLAGTTADIVSNDVDDQTEVNPDWSLTKTKTANLFSQVPTVQGAHENKKYSAAVPLLTKSLNYELGEKRTNIGTAMEEVLADVVNAAGIGAIDIDYAARFEDVDMPKVDTKMLPQKIVQMGMKMGLIPSQKVQRVVSDRFLADRLSPTDLLIPSELTVSDFDKGDFIGRSGRMSKSDAKHELKLTDEQLEKIASASEKKTEDDLRSGVTRSNVLDVEGIRYDKLYYWRHRVDPDCKHFDEIWKIVFVDGISEPVIHEAWKGQKLVDDVKPARFIGCRRFPIRVLTLTYITDNPIPPSDSAAGRPQVNDLRRSRSQMFQNRRYSIPLRWADSSRVDPMILDQIMRGNFQGIIPTLGDGSRAFGEVARASYPSEDFAFDQNTKADLMELWQLGPNQTGGIQPGRQTAAGVMTNQQNFATRIGQERGKCAKFFLGCCDALLGLMVLYSDFPMLTDEERQQMMQAWDSKHVLHDLVLKLRPDSTIVIDSQARVERLFKFLNMTVKSGFVDPLPIITEIAELSDIDPTDVVRPPQPKGPEEPNISFRFSGKDDIMNPAVLAFLAMTNKLPTPEALEAAKQFLTKAQEPAAPPPPPGAAPAAPGGTAHGAPGPHPPGPGGPDAVETHEDWKLGDRVAKRSRDVSGG